MSETPMYPDLSRQGLASKLFKRRPLFGFQATPVVHNVRTDESDPNRLSRGLEPSWYATRAIQSLRTSAMPLLHCPLEHGVWSALPQQTEVAATSPSGVEFSSSLWKGDIPPCRFEPYAP
jgi:hypothetical protein